MTETYIDESPYGEHLKQQTTMSEREEFKKLVIMGCHPECKTYEEALNCEVVDGCILKDERSTYRFSRRRRRGNTNQKCGAVVYERNSEKFPYDSVVNIPQYLLDECEIIGLPITIGRVMQALGKPYYFDWRHVIMKDIGGSPYHETEEIALWQLTKDGKELTDDDQADETISALLKLLK